MVTALYKHHQLLRSVLYGIPRKARFTKRCFQKIRGTSPYQSWKTNDKKPLLFFFSVQISITGAFLFSTSALLICKNGYTLHRSCTNYWALTCKLSQGRPNLVNLTQRELLVLHHAPWKTFHRSIWFFSFSFFKCVAWSC